MPVAKVHTRSLGFDAQSILVEAHVSRGLPKVAIVGLAEGAVKESLERIRSALQNAGFQFPPARITINLSPSNLVKKGNHYDLPIAIAFLLATKQIQATVEGLEFFGELGLDGSVRQTNGLFAAFIAAQQHNKIVIANKQTAQEAALLDSLKILSASNLSEVCLHLADKTTLQSPKKPAQPIFDDKAKYSFEDIKGQFQAKRSLILAAAGGHNLLMCGSPGAGKSMLANCLSELLPPLTIQQKVAIAKIYSTYGFRIDGKLWHRRPFRSPHHSASTPALVGGGSQAMPGEISLAHHGVLFLDELPEFRRDVLEALRQPLESGEVTIARASNIVTYPANFQLIGAMNPCPCGFLMEQNRCSCTSLQIQNYRKKISGPVLDRIDVYLSVYPVKSTELIDEQTDTLSITQIKQTINQCYRRQIQRQNVQNAFLTHHQLQKYIKLDAMSKKFFKQAIDKLHISARGVNRILKLARTIADLKDQKNIQTTHLKEALSYRPNFDA